MIWPLQKSVELFVSWPHCMLWWTPTPNCSFGFKFSIKGNTFVQLMHCNSTLLEKCKLCQCGTHVSLLQPFDKEFLKRNLVKEGCQCHLLLASTWTAHLLLHPPTHHLRHHPPLHLLLQGLWQGQLFEYARSICETLAEVTLVLPTWPNSST